MGLMNHKGGLQAPLLLPPLSHNVSHSIEVISRQGMRDVLQLAVLQMKEKGAIETVTAPSPRIFLMPKVSGGMETYNRH